MFYDGFKNRGPIRVRGAGHGGQGTPLFESFGDCGPFFSGRNGSGTAADHGPGLKYRSLLPMRTVGSSISTQDLMLLDPELFRTVLENLQTAVCLLDREGKIRFWNLGAEKMTGYQRHSVVGKSCYENILSACGGKGCDLCGDACPVARTIHEGKAQEINIYLRHRDGHRVPVRLWSTPVRDERGSVVGVTASFHGVSHMANRRQSRLAEHGCLDEATGVPNRSYGEFHLRENFAGFSEYGLPFGLIVVQLDELARLRAAYGHEAVPEVLRAVVETVRNCIRPTDFLGRWADDKFLVIAVNCASDGLEIVLQRLKRAAGRAEIEWWGDSLAIKTSFGHAAVQAGDSAESLLERAQQRLVSDPAEVGPISVSQETQQG